MGHYKRLFALVAVLFGTLNFQFSIFNFQFSPLHAQVWDSLCIESPHIDSTHVGQLRAEVNALAFFQNNEFSSKVAKGYTLPGAWLQPKFTYTPLPQIRLEAGAHLLLFDGANRYPNYAYHDIALWKGNQHTHGVHALPYFRAQASLPKLTLVLGNIYGAQNHQLILPLYNPEQNLSADPEMGFQMLLDRPHEHLDMWINWQSYIFNLDTHQEAFTVGVNSTLRWPRADERLVWEVPLQLLLQHRGGEIDQTDRGVQTVCNGSAGLRLTYRHSPLGTFNTLRAEANVLGSYQQHGTLWPFDTGLAIHAGVEAMLLRHLSVGLGYVGIPERYANLYGSPFFGTISLKHPGLLFSGMHTAYGHVGYAHAFTPAYQLGAQLDLYQSQTSSFSALTFGFGVYLRVCPSFKILKK